MTAYLLPGIKKTSKSKSTIKNLRLAKRGAIGGGMVFLKSLIYMKR